ncbi:hypothetical protein LC593_03600 [Nostoc sp. CHAB 5844]|nr:hypothetical protein [Nostoc sp. CHAB 5844]
MNKDFKAKMMSAWNGNPPRVEYKAEPMPGTPHIRLLGEGSSTAALDAFLGQLEKDFKQQKGKYLTYPLKSDQAEEDVYVLEGWEVYTSGESLYEALVILYYSALYPYQVIKKYMSEHLAQEYLDEMKRREQAITALTQALN